MNHARIIFQALYYSTLTYRLLLLLQDLAQQADFFNGLLQLGVFVANQGILGVKLMVESSNFSVFVLNFLQATNAALESWRKD